jgi:hypothetical protein
MSRNIGALDAGARRDIAKRGLIDAVGRAADQHEAPVAIAAIDIAMLVDLEEHAWMAQRCAAGNVGGAVAGVAAMGDADDFGRGDHAIRDSKLSLLPQSPTAVRPE